MKKILLLSILLCISVNSAVFANTRTVRTISNIPNNTNNYYYHSKAYDRDLNAVEKYLFGETFYNDNLASRLNRIERRLFNRIYPSAKTTDRMNRILANYRDTYYDSYLPDNRNKSTAQKLIDRFVGQPTGYTPPIINTPFNDYGYPIGINRNYASNRGYRFNNYTPTTGAGIHILD